MNIHYYFIVVFVLSPFLFHAQSNATIDSLYLQLNRSEAISDKVEILGDIGNTYATFNIDSVVHISDEMYAISKANNYQTGINRSYSFKGIYHYYKSEYDSAIVFFNKTAEKALKINDYKMAMKAYSNVASSYRALKDYYSAIGYYQKEMQLALTVNDKERLNYCYLSIAVIYYELKDYDTAISYFNTANEYAENEKNEELIYYINKNLALNYTKINRLDEAREHLNIAITADKKSGNAYNAMFSSSYLAEIFFREGNLNAALDHYTKSLEINKVNSFSNTALEAAIYTKIGEIHFKNQNLDLALEHLNSGYDISKKQGYNEIAYTISKLLYQLHKQKKQYNKALQYGEFAFKYNDSLQNEQKEGTIIKQLVDFERNHTTTLKEKEAKIASLQYRRNIFAVIGLSVCLLSALLVFKNGKLRIERNKAQLQLEEKTQLEHKLQNIESAIANDLHDNFGNRLTGVITSFDVIKDIIGDLPQAQSENYKKYTKLLDTDLGTFAQDIRDLLWASNPNNNATTPLIERFSTIIDSYNKKSSKKIAFEYQADNEYRLPKFANKQILLATKEAINNFEKHAKAETLKLSIHIKNKEIEIQVKDEGKGFNIRKLSRINGLNNIKKRIESINFNVAITSKQDFGTEIIFRGSLDSIV